MRAPEPAGRDGGSHAPPGRDGGPRDASADSSISTGGDGGVVPSEPCEPIPARGIGGRSAVAPRIATDGVGYGVLFAELAGDCGLAGWRFVGLDANGVGITEVVRLTATAAHQQSAMIRASGGYAATVASSDAGSPGIDLLRFDGSGVRVAPPRRLVEGSPSHDLVWTGTAFGFVWAEGGFVRFTRLDDDGARIGDEVVLSEGATGVDIAWGDGFALALSTDEGLGHSHLRLGDDGRPIGELTRLCCAATEEAWISGRPVVAAQPGGSAMAWADPHAPSRPIQLTRFDAMGRPIGTTDISPSGWTVHPEIASGPGEVGVVFRSYSSGERGVYFTRAGAATGAPLAPVRAVSLGHDAVGCDVTDGTSIVRTASGYAAAWSAIADDGTPRLWFAHLCPDDP